MTSVRLGLLADYTPLSRDYSFEGRRRLSVDRSPANPLIADYVHAQVTDTMASPYSGNRMSAMLSVFCLPSAQVESRFYLSGSMQSQTMADDAGSFFAMTTDSVARPGTDTACDTTYGRYAGTQSNKSLSLSTRQLFTVTPAFRLGLGLGFSTAAFQDSLLRAFIDRSYTAHNNGDTISGHEDWRRRVSSSADWLMRGTSSTNALSLPVGIEYKVVPAIALRLGFSHTITWSDQTWIEQLVASSPALTRIDYGDGTYSEFLGTAETQPGRSETHKTTAHATRYTYGIGFNPIDNLQIDLMGFAKLTDLANWRLSATLKF
jgi:hypothetical protein